MIRNAGIYKVVSLSDTGIIYRIFEEDTNAEA